MFLDKDFELLDSGIGIVSGKPKRRLRRIITRPIGFLTRPLKTKAKKRLKRGVTRRVKALFEKPTESISVREALEMDLKEIKKRKKK